MTTKVNADLQRERDKCTFNVTELINLIDGGEDKTAERKSRGMIPIPNNVFFVCVKKTSFNR